MEKNFFSLDERSIKRSKCLERGVFFFFFTFSNYHEIGTKIFSEELGEKGNISHLGILKITDFPL